MIRELATWIANTSMSHLFQNVSWVVPTSQSIHVVCIGVVFGAAVMISLRLLGVPSGGRSISQLVATLVPWMYRALVILLMTGLVQTIAEPERQFVAPVFWIKMLMIICVVLLTSWFASSVRKRAGQWDSAARPAAAKPFAVVSLFLWVAVIACGRFIGYTYSFYL